MSSKEIKNKEKDKDTEIKTLKKENTDGETIVISDFLGCPKKNKKKKI